MLAQQFDSLLAVASLLVLRLCVPFVLTWLFGQALRRIVPTSA